MACLDRGTVIGISAYLVMAIIWLYLREWVWAGVFVGFAIFWVFWSCLIDYIYRDRGTGAIQASYENSDEPLHP